MNKKFKSILSLIINISIISAFSVSASAEDNIKTLNLSGGYAEENSLTSITASIDDEANAAAYSITLNYNPDYLEFIKADNNSEYGKFYYNNISDDSVNIIWSDDKNRNLKGNIFTAEFKTKGDTAGLTVPVEVGNSIMGNTEMQEIPFENSYCEITVLEKYLWGDSNNDGIVSVADVTAINKFNIDSKKYSLSSEMLINSDADKNKIINIHDCNAILNYVKNNTKEKR